MASPALAAPFQPPPSATSIMAAALCIGCDERVPTAPYRVTSHGGVSSLVLYCADCAELAACDWNGETASIVPAASILLGSKPLAWHWTDDDRTHVLVAYWAPDGETALTATCLVNRGEDHADLHVTSGELPSLELSEAEADINGPSRYRVEV